MCSVAKKVVVSCVIFLIFSVSVYFLQLRLESTENEIIKAVLFSIIIAFGSFSYDVGKLILYVDEVSFKRLLSAFESALKNYAIMLVVLVLIFFSFDLELLLNSYYILLLVFLFIALVYLLVSITNSIGVVIDSTINDSKNQELREDIMSEVRKMLQEKKKEQPKK